MECTLSGSRSSAECIRAALLLLICSSMINPMDWILNRTVEQTPLGVSIAEESFTDLDFADDVSLPAEMLEILVAGLLLVC